MNDMHISLRHNPHTRKRDVIVDRRQAAPLSRWEKQAWVDRLTRHPLLKISGLGRIVFVEAEPQ